MKERKDFQRSTLLRWIAVSGLGILSLCINSPEYPPGTEIKANGDETFSLAESIAKHHRFADPFWVLPTGLQLIWLRCIQHMWL
jgi:hypothetical protein